MRLTLTLVNVLSGLIAIALTLGTFNIRRAVGDARQARAAQEPPSEERAPRRGQESS
jgi:hypothetical protein